MTEIGFVMEPSPRTTATLARRLEAMGFDLLLCPDTQNLSADPYGQLSLAAAATTRLRLGTGVTNPVTRDAAVTASAMATLQLESGGRAVCGIGRGDSSAAHIGKRQASTAELANYATTVAAYLARKTVPRGETASTIRWLAELQLPKVPIDIACTGPKTIAMAVDCADRISFAVGSAPERLSWAMDQALKRLRESGRRRDSVKIGAYVNIVCHAERERAVQLARMGVGLVAHFTGMKHAPTEHLPPRLRTVAEQLKSGYDMQRHAQEHGRHLADIDDEFVRWFAIAGDPHYCRTRLKALIELGLDHLYFITGSPVAAPHAARVTASVDLAELAAREVLPALRNVT
ncbi:MAG: LLM class flavin-dependent oxidoreductase [Steroidobacteraceae bacterium]